MLPLGEDTKGIRRMRMSLVIGQRKCHPHNSSCFKLVFHQRSTYPSFCWCLTSKQIPKPSNNWTLLICCPLVRTPRGSGDFIGCRSAVLRTTPTLLLKRTPSLCKKQYFYPIKPILWYSFNKPWRNTWLNIQ